MMLMCFSLCYIPQLIHTWKTKKVEDIDIKLWILALAGYIFALIYLQGQNGKMFWPLLLNYIACGTLAVLQLILYYMYRGKSSAAHMKDTLKRRYLN